MPHAAREPHEKLRRRRTRAEAPSMRCPPTSDRRLIVSTNQRPELGNGYVERPSRQPNREKRAQTRCDHGCPSRPDRSSVRSSVRSSDRRGEPASLAALREPRVPRRCNRTASCPAFFSPDAGRERSALASRVSTMRAAWTVIEDRLAHRVHPHVACGYALSLLRARLHVSRATPMCRCSLPRRTLLRSGSSGT